MTDLIVVGNNSGAYRKTHPKHAAMPNLLIIEKVTMSGTKFFPDAKIVNKQKRVLHYGISVLKLFYSSKLYRKCTLRDNLSDTYAKFQGWLV